MTINSNSKQIKKELRCKICPRKGTYRIEVITDLLWEEHHHDFSKSILNPKLQYQALFLVKKNDSDSNLISNVKRICFPINWMLKGEDIIDIRINNSICPFFTCVFQDEEKHLIVDLQHALGAGDSFYFIANMQDIWRTNVSAFSDFLNRFLILKNEWKWDIENFYKKEKKTDNEEKTEKEFLEHLGNEINTDYLEKACTKKSRFKSKRYIFHYLLYCDPMPQIDLVDYWIKIPNICEIEESWVWDCNSEKTCFMIVDENYLSILKEKNLKKVVQNIQELEEINNSMLMKAKEIYRTEISKLEVIGAEEKLSKKLENMEPEELNEYLFKKIKPMRYQSSEVDHQLYHLRVKKLTTNILIRNVLKIKKEILRWYRLPIFLSILQISIALGFLFFSDFISFFLPDFNTWFFLTFSINILTLLLISLNWGTLHHLRLLKPQIYSIYLKYILASLIILIIAIIIQPFISSYTKMFFNFILAILNIK